VISPSLFAMMVIMALVTTIATGPVLQLLGVVPRGRFVHAAADSGVMLSDGNPSTESHL